MPAAELLAAAFSLLADPSHACAVCFGGDGNETIIRALFVGGGILLLILFAIVGTFVRYIVKTEKLKEETFRKMGLMKEGHTSGERFFG